MSTKVFEIVTQRIVELLNTGTVPWKKSWKGAQRPMNMTTGKAYNGINFFTLSCMPFTSPFYVTLNQLKKLGGKIKTDENGATLKGFPVFYWLWPDNKNVETDGTTPKYRAPHCLYTLVWNIEQLDGVTVPAKYLNTETATHTPLQLCEAIIAGFPNAPAINIVDGSNRACYSPMYDSVTIPHLNQFNTPENYYSTMFHELTHSTGHEKRLARKGVTDPIVFGSHEYSSEELCAEMGAAYLCAHAGIDNTLDNSAAYIASWIKVLKNDPRMLMDAAGRAQKAFNHILGVASYVDAD